jgi:hypothetical protein
VKYNKSLKNVQGKVEVITSPTAYDLTDPLNPRPTERYRIVSTAISVLAFTGCTADFSAKCNVNKQTATWNATLNDYVWVETQIEGGTNISIAVTDVSSGLNGLGSSNTVISPDKVAVTVYKKAGGGIWYSNNWNGTQTVKEDIYSGCVRATCGNMRTVDEIATTTQSTMLLQNYPNPFNGETTIVFDLAEEGPISLNVYNSMGQLVTTLHDGNLGTGTHKFAFKGNNVSAGIYYYTLTGEGFKETRRMVLVK